MLSARSKPDHDFLFSSLQVSPDQGINEVSFVIRVLDPSRLDFESVKVLNFTIVAREVVDFEPHESRAKVTIHIRDQNDNSPEFNKNRCVRAFVRWAINITCCTY